MNTSKTIENDTNDSAAGFFGRNAENFFNRYGESAAFKERYKLWTEKLKEHISANSKVLDIGCGPGIFSFFIASICSEIIGVDGANEMVEFCNNRKVALSIKNAHFYREMFPFFPPNEKYLNSHVVIASSLLEYIHDLDEAFACIKATMADKGILILSVPNEESLYRKAEKTIYSLIRRPKYYKYVKHLFKLEAFNHYMDLQGFSYLDSKYYSSSLPDFIRYALPSNKGNDLFLGIYQKK